MAERAPSAGSLAAPRPGAGTRAPRARVEARTPWGDIWLCADDAGLCGLFWADHRPAPPSAWRALPVDRGPFRVALDELEEYAAGSRAQFSVELSLYGTEFQRAVWRELATIPYGHTETYGTLAARLGRPRAGRAVGAANARNPVSIILACHRVVGSGGGLTGYAGGLACKQALLAHEIAYRDRIGADRVIER